MSQSVPIPSYRQGFARQACESRYPGLWRGCVGAWCPGLGPTGSTLYDWSGRKRAGTLTNMDPATDWVLSGGGYALDHDGSNDRTSLGAIPEMDGAVQFSLSAWIATVSRPSNFVYSGIFMRRGATFNQRAGIMLGGASAGDSDDLIFQCGNGGNTYGYTTLNFLSDAVWHHVAWIYDGNQSTNALKLLGYIDGIARTLTFSGTIPTTLASDGGALQLGTDGASTFTNVQIDDARAYSRVLTPPEIRLLSQRRGIAYEQRNRSYKSAGYNRRRRLLCAGVS